MHSKRRKTQTIIVVVLSVLMLLMGVGFAVSTQQIRAITKGRILRDPILCHFVPETLSTTINGDSTGVVSSPTFGKDNLIFNLDLKLPNPGGSATYTFSLENSGKTPIRIDSLTVDGVPASLHGIAKAELYFGDIPLYVSGDPSFPSNGYGTQLEIPLMSDDPVLSEMLTVSNAPGQNRKQLSLRVGYDDAYVDHLQELPLGQFGFNFSVELHATAQ